MSRGLSANNLTAATALHVRPLMFVELRFNGGTRRIHNGVGTYTWGGNTWTGIGALGQVGPIEEGVDLSPYAVQMALNAFPEAALLTELKHEQIYNRPASLYVGLLDENGQLVADPQERWGGGMDHVTVHMGGDDRIELLCESELKFLDRANGSLFTDEDQQRRYPGDVFFEFLDQVVDDKIPWSP